MSRLRDTSEPRWALTVLLIAFVFCKAAQVTAIAGWPWWKVLLPAIIPACLAALFGFGLLVGFAVLTVTENLRARRLAVHEVAEERLSGGRPEPTFAAIIAVNDNALRLGLYTRDAYCLWDPDRRAIIIEGDRFNRLIIEGDRLDTYSRQGAEYLLALVDEAIAEARK